MEIKYNSNLQKAGAAIQDVKILLRYWNNNKSQKDLIDDIITNNVLGKKSRKRTYDILRCIFLPRFINGYPDGHWIYLKKIIESNISSEVIDSLLFFYTALNEPLIYDFVTEYLYNNYRKGILGVNSSDTKSFIKTKIKEKVIKKPWSEAVIDRVASGLFAALKDFRLLEGNRKRKIRTKLIPVPVFYYIAFFIYKNNYSANDLISHDHWKLYLLNKVEVEHLLMEAHQHKYLIYEQLGDIRRISFEEDTFEEAADVIIKRKN